MSGARPKLSIELDAFWVEPDVRECERIFFSDIQRAPIFLWLPDYGGQYTAMVLQTQNGKRMFYFLPDQFKQLIETICRT
jgi:hypothetical protein